MEEKLSEKFIEEMAKVILPILVENGIDEELHYSITTDLVFQMANLFDEGSISYKGKYRPTVEFKGKKKAYSVIDGLHELVYGVLDVDDFDELYPKEKDYCICFLKIIREKGIKHEINVLRSMTEIKDSFVEGLEMALEVRDIDEINKPLDIEHRLKEKELKYGKIIMLKYQYMDSFFSDNWESKNYSGDGSIDSLITSITDAINGYNQAN